MAGGEREDALVMDSGEKRLNELGYKQELRREMVLSVPTPTPLSSHVLRSMGLFPDLWEEHGVIRFE